MSLQHELGLTGARIPELDAAILGTRENPCVIRRESDTEYEITVSFKCLGAPPALEWRLLVHTAGSRKFPHLDRLVQAAAHQFTAARGKRHTVNAILVSVGALEALDEITSLNVPHPNTLIE